MGCGSSKSVATFDAPPRKKRAVEGASSQLSLRSHHRERAPLVEVQFQEPPTEPEDDYPHKKQSKAATPVPSYQQVSNSTASLSRSDRQGAKARAVDAGPVVTKFTRSKSRSGFEFIEADRFSASLTYEQAAQSKPETIEEMWAIVKGTSDQKALNVEPLKNRKGWRTIRIFVSSTFKDFHSEREVLVKEVFPDLRLWCEQRKLRLVECDLRWGVPKDSTTEETIRICLSELDRCYEDNTAPFFLNLCGERAGWIPGFDDLTQNLAAQYGWVYGLSVTEMEIVHGAFRKLNPNAFFLMRDPTSVAEIPSQLKEDFIDSSDVCVRKLKTLKSMITSTFPETCVHSYKAKPLVKNGKLEFDGLTGESEFSKLVYDFFKTRIEQLYPLDPSPEDPLQVQKEAHETFLDSRSQNVLGRDKILEQIRDYYLNDRTCSPLLVIGTAGAGKSAVMAKSAHDASTMAAKGQIPSCPGGNQWRVFFHFVGATPGSTDLAFFLQRLTKELKPDIKDILSDLESLIQLANSLLSNPNTRPMILFIDAVNQLDEDKQQFLKRWLPEQLSPNVRAVVSMIEGTPSHQMCRAFRPSPKEIVCGPLDRNSRTEIVSNILRMYNKRLDNNQMDALIVKEGSSNPLWLTLACEELRVFGRFEDLLDKIESLPNDLISLETDVFSRFEQETGGTLMTATLCLLETSRHGLLETELLALLGDENNLVCPPYVEGQDEELVKETEGVQAFSKPIDTNKDEVELLTDKFSKLIDDTYKIKDEDKDAKKTLHSRPRGKQIRFLPARDWAIIYRNLKPLLRPCGDLGEGRLDFYHRSLSKAVRQKYFAGSEGHKKHMYNFWHGVLASYFEEVDDMDRKAEELPYHLEQLVDNNRLIRCLLEWPVFERLYSEDFSIDLLHSWLKAGGYPVAAALYKESLQVYKDSGVTLYEYADLMEKVAVFIIQAGQYTDAYEILGERVDLEAGQLGSRPDKLADIYQLMAKCKSEVVKNHNFVTMDQLEEDIEVVAICKKSAEFRDQLPGEEHQFKGALNKILLCHHLSIMADLEQKDQHRQEAFQMIDEAIAVFERVNDLGHLSEAIMTKSFVNPRAARFFPEKEKQLQKAMELCLKAYGEKHLLYCRLCLNIGILHEDNRDFQTAYDYFVKWNKACLEVLGPTHPKTKRAKDTLNESTYLSIREQRERTAAGTA